MRMKLDKHDRINKEQETEQKEAGISLLATASARFHLGAPEEHKKSLSALMKTTRFPVPNFMNILESFINRFRTAAEGYYKVQKELMVIMFVPLLLVKVNMCNVWQIMEFHYLRVTYKSMVDWQDVIDILRCNDSFYGQPRYDHVIVATENGSFFAQLLCLFQLQVETHSHSLALVRVYGRPPGSTRRKDRDLGLYRVRVKGSPYAIVTIESIVRGALLVKDVDIPDECFVVDTIDGDMFLRTPTLFPYY